MRIALAIVSGFATGCAVRPAAPRPRPGSRTCRGRDVHLAEALPVRGDVAGVADRDAERVERPPSASRISNAAVFCPSSRNGLTELTSAIGWRSAELAHELQRLVEVAAQRDHARAVHQRLGELAGRDLALRHDHRAAQPGPRRVGGGATRRCCRSRRRSPPPRPRARRRTPRTSSRGP